MIIFWLGFVLHFSETAQTYQMLSNPTHWSQFVSVQYIIQLLSAVMLDALLDQVLDLNVAFKCMCRSLKTCCTLHRLKVCIMD